MNTAIATDGVVARFPKGKVAASPLIIVHLSVGSNAGTNSRALVFAEDLSEGKVVEIFFNWGNGSVWANHVSEILVENGANLEWVTIQNDLGGDYALTNFTQVHQGGNSTFRSTVMSSDGKLVRNDLQVLHQGSGCNTYLNGLTLLDGDAHVDHHTLVDHALPHCYSNETYKTVLDGNSTAVFNGKVMVRPDAQKTNAFQSNKTLLLSDGATVNAKPQLEIYADDVKCSHGATTGRLDETALFYLRSRGLSAKRAQALLTYAFGAEVLDQIGIAEVREHLESQLLERLTGESK
ncbi:MAG: Fe-S cluster assembly protein SufD [Bacteroidia bacterium]